MLRGSAQQGAPFEAATVPMKSDLRGSGRVTLPLAFIRGEDGRWRAKWLHFYLKGLARMNVVQASKFSTSLLARTVIERDYLRVGYLAALLAKRTPGRAAAAQGRRRGPPHRRPATAPTATADLFMTAILASAARAAT